jgi:hypothetical protein
MKHGLQKQHKLGVFESKRGGEGSTGHCGTAS